jgi:hypothetical protein
VLFPISFSLLILFFVHLLLRVFYSVSPVFLIRYSLLFGISFPANSLFPIQENFNRDIGVLVALSVGLRIAAYLALLLRTRRKS